MTYMPVIQPKDIAVKNDGKFLILKISGKQYEMKRDTIRQLCDMVDYITKAKHPTAWITGYEDIKKEEQIELWPSGPELDNDPIVGAM